MSALNVLFAYVFSIASFLAMVFGVVVDNFELL